VGKALDQQFDPDQDEKYGNGQHDRVNVHCFAFICTKFNEMALKLFRVLWFVSVLLVVFNLLYIYAGLPFEVVVSEQGERVTVSRELLFYGMLAGVVLMNVLVYIFKYFYPQGEDFRAWFHGLLITFNIFCIVALWSLSVYNSLERFNPSLVTGYLLGSLGLSVIWAAGWPLYLLYQKIFVKATI